MTFPTTPEPRVYGDVAKKRSTPSQANPWQRVAAWTRALNEHWLGDLLGAASLFLIAYAGLLFGWVMQ